LPCRLDASWPWLQASSWLICLVMCLVVDEVGRQVAMRWHAMQVGSTNSQQQQQQRQKVNHQSPLGGLEPPTLRLTAARSNQLSHKGLDSDAIGGSACHYRFMPCARPVLVVYHCVSLMPSSSALLSQWPCSLVSSMLLVVPIKSQCLYVLQCCCLACLSVRIHPRQSSSILSRHRVEQLCEGGANQVIGYRCPL
jgi:hypothetical protein